MLNTTKAPHCAQSVRSSVTCSTHTSPHTMPPPPLHLHHVDPPVCQVLGQQGVQHHIVLIRGIAAGGGGGGARETRTGSR